MARGQNTGRWLASSAVAARRLRHAIGRCKLARTLWRPGQLPPSADDSFAAGAVSAIRKRLVYPLWLFVISRRLTACLLGFGVRCYIVAHELGPWRGRPGQHRAKYHIPHLFIRASLGRPRFRARAKM